MDGSIVLYGGQHKRLLKIYRKEQDPALRLRAHIILLLADGQHFECGGVTALLEERRGRKESASGPLGMWANFVVRWVLKLQPSFFGLIRSRWCCEALALVLFESYHVKVGREAVRRWLRKEPVVWRRPRPILRPKDPLRKPKLRELRDFRTNLPPEEAAVFQDEVDVNSNPKIGCMWMPKGEQAQVPTPGTNQKKYIAGSLDWRTGKLAATMGFAV